MTRFTSMLLLLKLRCFSKILQNTLHQPTKVSFQLFLEHKPVWFHFSSACSIQKTKRQGKDSQFPFFGFAHLFLASFWFLSSQTIFFFPADIIKYRKIFIGGVKDRYIFILIGFYDVKVRDTKVKLTRLAYFHWPKWRTLGEEPHRRKKKSKSPQQKWLLVNS